MRLLRPNRKLDLAVDERGGPVSLDQQINDAFAEILKEAQDIDDPDMKELWLDGLSTYIKTGDIKSLYDITKWRWGVVPLDEFLFGAAYLQLKENEVYPGIMDALVEIDSDRYDEVVEKGAIGIGKTTLANLAMARDLYKLSCMRSPQQTYGIATGSPIVFTIQSVRLTTARKVVFEEFGRYVRNSPYFQSKFPFDPLLSSEMLFREHNIKIMPVSSSGSAVISMNVIGGQMDEVNFLQKILKSKSSQADEQGSFDQARQLYNTLASRRKSRFLKRGDLPGALYLISSSRFPEDFTEQKAAEAESHGGTDPRIFVFEGSQWSVKGRENFSPIEFTVQIGNETSPSKVLKEGDLPASNCETIQVPIDFIDDFSRDVDGAIRDFAGRTTLATRPFLTQRHKIGEGVELAREHGYVNPCDLEEVEFSIGFPILDKRKLRTDVKADRHAHVDLGISHDACGIAVGHICGHMIRETKEDIPGTDQQKTVTEVLPAIAYDVILRVVPPLGGEIQLEDIRKFLKLLNSKYHLNIKSVTFDGFASIDSRQLLNKAGFKAGYLSVEKPEPWRAFRDALYDGRVLLTGHNYLNKELAEVERTVHNNKEKIDHRANGTKDVADGVVGVAAYLLSRRVAWQSVKHFGGKVGLFLLGNRKKAADNVISDKTEEESTHRPKTLRRSIERRSMQRK